MAKEITKEVVQRITRNLVDFGYGGMFTQGMLIENGYIEEGEDGS
jgi:hypothetical protein